MEVVLFVTCGVFMFVSFIMGYFTGCRDANNNEKKSLGTLQIDHSDPDMPYLFLLDYDLDYIATHKQAVFDVKVENIISHE